MPCWLMLLQHTSLPLRPHPLHVNNKYTWRVLTRVYSFTHAGAEPCGDFGPGAAVVELLMPTDPLGHPHRSWPCR